MFTIRILIALAALLFFSGCQSQKAQQRPGGMPPVPVSVAVATQESIPIELRAVGTVEPSVSVQVKSQIAGELMKVHFVEGGNVKKGALLFTIDPRPYQEALRQAEAALQRDTAQLAQAEANLTRDLAQAKFNDADAARYEQLAREGVVSKTQYDQSKTAADTLHESMKAGRAAIESIRASLESDRAAIAAAKLNLGYCEIRSPISGRAGNLLVHAGNLVKANDVPLVVINQLAPIFASFGVPEEHLSTIRRNDAEQRMAVNVSPQDDPGKTVRGALTVIDNTVDTNTGTIRLKATFANETGVLWPGQFVNVMLTLDTRKDATVVPTEALQAGQRGQMIYVVKNDKTVEARPVTVLQTLGRKAIIDKGVAPGETVVTDGQMALFPGARIVPVPAAQVESQRL